MDEEMETKSLGYKQTTSMRKWRFDRRKRKTKKETDGGTSEEIKRDGILGT